MEKKVKVLVCVHVDIFCDWWICGVRGGNGFSTSVLPLDKNELRKMSMKVNKMGKI